MKRTCSYALFGRGRGLDERNAEHKEKGEPLLNNKIIGKDDGSVESDREWT